MQTLNFDIHIAAPRQAVWATMLHSPGYEQWTAAFCEGSRYEGSWEAGQRIRFMGPDSDQGMVAEIAAHRPAEFVSIRHLGVLQDGREDLDSEAVRAWAPCYEDYHFSDASGGGMRLQVQMDIQDSYEAMMSELWPQALARLKAICETAASSAPSPAG